MVRGRRGIPIGAHDCPGVLVVVVELEYQRPVTTPSQLRGSWSAAEFGPGRRRLPSLPVPVLLCAARRTAAATVTVRD